MSEQIIMKRCSKCKQSKSISEFGKNRSTRDGYQFECKSCCRDASTRYRQTEKGRVYQKNYQVHYSKTEKGKATQKRYAQSEKGKKSRKRSSCKWYHSGKGKAIQKRYSQSDRGKANKQKGDKQYKIHHPERIKAKSAVECAVKKGQLPPPDSLQCSCGKPAKQYHHHKGYAPEHWLDVIPVCVDCHSKETW